MKNQFIELRKQIGRLLFKFSEVTLPNGETLIFEGDQPVEGGTVNTYAADGNTVPANDGSYVLENGDTIDVKDGVVTMITPKPVETPMAVDPNAPEVPEVEVPEPQDTEVLVMVQSLIETVAGFEERLSAMEELMNGMNMTVTKMSAHIPVDEIKKEITLSKMEKTEIAANKAARILGS